MSKIRKGKSFIGGAANQTFDGNTEFNTISYAQATGRIVADLSMGIVTREFTPSVENPLKILPVGDSITYGLTNSEFDDLPKDNETGGYRNFLDQFLIADDLGEAVDFVGSQKTGSFDDNEHEGHSGQTISFISNGITGWLNQQQPDMLLLMIGTNDSHKYAPNPGQADERLSALLDRITSNSPTTHVLVASIPPIDSSVRPDQSQNAQAYNAQIPGIVEQKVAQGNKVTFVDVNNALTVDDIFDGVHPSLEGYEKIANSWYDWIQSSQDTLFGINHITGTFYDDELIGNENDNVIEGGAGNDLITGGAGKDTFILALGEGTDTITDFSVSEDSLDLWLGLTSEQLSITQGTGNNIDDTWITHNDSGEQLALLRGVQAEDVNSAIEASDLSLVTVNGTAISNPVEIYGSSSQNVTGLATLSPDNQLKLNGNLWRTVKINSSTITSDTILRFDFNSNGKGEIQGIGFDNDKNIGRSDAQHFFQVDGSQSWGNQNLDQYFVGERSGFKQYEIEVGQFFTGEFDYLTIANDHDVNNPDATAWFRNIELLTPNTNSNPNPNPNPNTSLDISIDGAIQSEEVKSYGGASQNPDITTTISNNNTQLQLEGNGWRRLNLNGYQITSETVLRFEFNSNGKGEVQGIGFDNNNNISRSSDAQQFFQVDGNQSWGNQNLNQYIVAENNGFTKYEITVGNFFTGQYDYLTIANDHDVTNPDAIAEFRNIELFSAVVNPDPDPNPNPNTSLDISIDGVIKSEEVKSYGGASQNPDITTTISSNNTQVKLEGNGWRRLNLNGYQITSETVLRFEFNSNGKGEVQGIGFDNNNNISRSSDAQQFFQVDGNQSWGIEDVDQYIVGQSEGFDQYSIAIGDFFTGKFDYLTIANDHDVTNPTAIGEFRNISLT